MEKLDRRTNAMIEQLYRDVKAYAENEYNVESSLDITKKESTKLIFKDRKKAITMIKEAIEEFAEEHKVDKNFVKNYILELIEKDLNSDKPYKEEYKAVREMVSTSEEEKEER